MTARCIECGVEIDVSEKRGCRKYCLECAHDVNLEKTRERWHFKKEHFETHPGPQEGHYWELVWAAPEHDDLIGIQLTNVDFKYGDYSYLKGAILERAGKLYSFDGRRPYVKVE